MKKVLLLALFIVFTASSAKAQSCADEKTNAEALQCMEKKLEMVAAQKDRLLMAGFVSVGGDPKDGNGYSVMTANTTYIITFDKKLDFVPVAVATGNGGPKGAFVIISRVDQTGITVEGRRYEDNGLVPTGFWFMVARP